MIEYASGTTILPTDVVVEVSAVCAFRALEKRRAGILMHISSLPGKYGIGDFGRGAEEFVDRLAEVGCSAWQILPLSPIAAPSFYSPYSSPSAFAGNTLFIDPDGLADLGLIERKELRRYELPASNRVDFARVAETKKQLLLHAYENFRRNDAYKDRHRLLSDEFWNFCVEEAFWLEDYALFTTLKETVGDVAWNEWPAEYAFRDWSVLDPFKRRPEVSRLLDICRFEQFLFFRQLAGLRSHCKKRDVPIVGDLPIYVGYDSSDVWGHQELFELDRDGSPTSVAGVPPDYFSDTGQRWGNPIYRWERMKLDGYGWWQDRFRHALRCADVVRIDHFRGLIGYWSIPADEPTALNGTWKEGPGRDFFHVLRQRFGDEEGKLPFVAEDLGVITDDVRAVMEAFDLPGMKVLQFAFGENMPENPYIPHMHRQNSVAYIGTHDNNTTIGWWDEDARTAERTNFLRYAGMEGSPSPSSSDVLRAMTRMLLASTANLVVLTAQDVLGLDGSARMNIPSTTAGNWTWRLKETDALKARSAEIRKLAILFGRQVERRDHEVPPSGRLS